MSAWHTVIGSVFFTWLGMVVAICVIEAPVRYRVRSVSRRIGRGIGGRLLRMLNVVEIVMADVVVFAMLTGQVPAGVVVAAGASIMMLTLQRLMVRPWLCQPPDALLAGKKPANRMSSVDQRRVLYAYAGLETVKVVALVLGGVVVMAT